MFLKTTFLKLKIYVLKKIQKGFTKHKGKEVARFGGAKSAVSQTALFVWTLSALI